MLSLLHKIFFRFTYTYQENKSETPCIVWYLIYAHAHFLLMNSIYTYLRPCYRIALIKFIKYCSTIRYTYIHMCLLYKGTYVCTYKQWRPVPLGIQIHFCFSKVRQAHTACESIIYSIAIHICFLLQLYGDYIFLRNKWHT